MNHRSRALVLGGIFSNRERLGGLADELEHQLSYDHVEAFTYPEALRNLGSDGSYSSTDLRDTDVYAHSGSGILVREAARVFALAGVEPTRPMTAVWRAGRMALNASSGIASQSRFLDSFNEVRRNPEHVRVLINLGRSSTITQLICRRGHFEEVFYLPPKGDRLFSDGHIAAMAMAKRHSMVAEYIGTGHTYALDYPKETASSIKELVEASPQQPALDRVIA